MSLNSDSLFVKEFKGMMNNRKSCGKAFNISSFPVPAMTSMIEGHPKNTMVLLKGIKEKFFDRLNDEEVQIVPRGTLYKRKVLSDGSFMLDKNGKEVKQPVSVKNGFVAILSSRSIGLKRKIEVDGKVINHVPTDGYAYVDYIETQKGRKYIYIIPKDYVYRLNMCALVLSINSLRNYYKGSKLALQDGRYINIYIVPYKYRENSGVRVLGVKSNVDFDKELSELLKLWHSKGIIFDIRTTFLEENYKGINNMGIVKLNGITTENYKRYTLPLSKEKEDTLEDM